MALQESSFDMSTRLHVWGEYACFTRPEMKVERVSYDVMTPSAARGILEAIHWKPQIRWHIDRIHVLRPIRFQNIRRNEVASKIPASSVRKAMRGENPGTLHLLVDEDRQQRATLALRNVAYVIDAHFEMTAAGNNDSPAKHQDMFRRRAAAGQCFHQPYFGVREFPAHFELIEDVPASTLDTPDRDLGWMLYDIDFTNGNTPSFFRAQLANGVLDVTQARAGGVAR